MNHWRHRSLAVLILAVGMMGSSFAHSEELAIACSSVALRDELFDANARWQRIAGPFQGCEGAAWVDDRAGGYLLFAAHHDFLAFRWSPAGGLSVWRRDTPETSAFRPDGNGGFFVVEQTTRRLARYREDGSVELLADRFEGNRLNRPNDLVVQSNGVIWFTDPDFLFKQRPADIKELPGQYVFAFNAKSKTLSAAAIDLQLPNGIALAPDESHLYVTDSATPNIYVWPVLSDSRLGERATFATISAKGLDGLAFDRAGRLWAAARDGVHVFTADGKDLGVIATPEKPTAIAFRPGPNCAVFVTTRTSAYWAPFRSASVNR